MVANFLTLKLKSYTRQPQIARQALARNSTNHAPVAHQTHTPVTSQRFFTTHTHPLTHSPTHPPLTRHHSLNHNSLNHSHAGSPPTHHSLITHQTPKTKMCKSSSNRYLNSFVQIKFKNNSRIIQF